MEITSKVTYKYPKEIYDTICLYGLYYHIKNMKFYKRHNMFGLSMIYFIKTALFNLKYTPKALVKKLIEHKNLIEELNASKPQTNAKDNKIISLFIFYMLLLIRLKFFCPNELNFKKDEIKLKCNECIKINGIILTNIYEETIDCDDMVSFKKKRDRLFWFIRELYSFYLNSNNHFELPLFSHVIKHYLCLYYREFKFEFKGEKIFWINLFRLLVQLPDEIILQILDRYQELLRLDFAPLRLRLKVLVKICKTSEPLIAPNMKVIQSKEIRPHLPKLFEELRKKNEHFNVFKLYIHLKTVQSLKLPELHNKEIIAFLMNINKSREIGINRKHIPLINRLISEREIGIKRWFARLRKPIKKKFRKRFYLYSHPVINSLKV